jgi:hypothetical protein
MQPTSLEVITLIFNQLSTRPSEVRVGWTNIYGDTEGGRWQDWSKEVRSTNNIDDIQFVIVYDGEEPVFIEIKALEVRIFNTTTSIRKDIVNQIMTKLQEI